MVALVSGAHRARHVLETQKMVALGLLINFNCSRHLTRTSKGEEFSAKLMLRGGQTNVLGWITKK